MAYTITVTGGETSGHISLYVDGSNIRRASVVNASSNTLRFDFYYRGTIIENGVVIKSNASGTINHSISSDAVVNLDEANVTITITTRDSGLIKFSKINITGTGNQSQCHVTVGGSKFYSAAALTVPIGTSVVSGGYSATTTVNGSSVAHPYTLTTDKNDLNITLNNSRPYIVAIVSIKTSLKSRVMVTGTVYEVINGKTLIGGTVYEVINGKTLIGGTAYKI